MKKNVHLVLLFCLILNSLTSFAQQNPSRFPGPLTDTAPLEFPPTNDSSIVPLLNETPAFPNYNFVLKQRLDSIEKSIPLPYNEFVQKYIDVYSARKSSIGKMLGLGGYYFPIFEKALKAYNVPLEIKYLPVIESAMNPYAVSRVGATGLWQFMFATAKGYGLNIDQYVDERRDPIQASYAAAAYFSDAYTEFGDWLLAIAAYNCGMGSVKRAIERAGSRDFWEVRRFLPLETRNYVPAFIATVYMMNCWAKHDITAQESGLSETTDTVQVSRFISLPKLATALNVEPEALCLMNPAYRKKIVNGTASAPKRLIMPRVAASSYDLVYNVLNGTDTEQPLEKIAAGNTPPPALRYHRVKAGQNLSVIADQYRVEVQDLKVWNRLKSNTILPGQRLIVGKTATEPKSDGKTGKQFTSAAEMVKAKPTGENI